MSLARDIALLNEPCTLHGATPAYLARLAGALVESSSGPCGVLATSESQARQVASDLGVFLGPSAQPILSVPAVESHPYADLSPDRAGVAARLAALAELCDPERRPPVIVASTQSLCRRVIAPDIYRSLCLRIRRDEDIDRDDLLRALAAAGYVRAGVVEDPGSFAARGGIVDLFPSVYRYPVRIDLFGDTVESIRTFDPGTQRTLRDLDEVRVHPVRETIETEGSALVDRVREAADEAMQPSKETRGLLDMLRTGEPFVGIEALTPAFHNSLSPLPAYFPEDMRWIIVDPEAQKSWIADQHELALARYRDRMDDHRLAFPPHEHYVSEDDLSAVLSSPARVEARPLELAAPVTKHVFRAELADHTTIRSALVRTRRTGGDGILAPLLEELSQWHKDGWRVAIVCASRGRRDRLSAMLAEYEAPHDLLDELPRNDVWPLGQTILALGELSAGFVAPREQLALMTDADIFGERSRTTARQKAAARRAKQALLGNVGDFSQLREGDFLVHQIHGVGHYKGLTKLPVGGTPIDFLHLEYVGGNLYLPVYRLGEVQRYVGAEGKAPKLDKLGGASWAKQRKKAKRDVQALAEQLLQLYAQRASLAGHAFPPSDSMFRDFEASFEFEETPDQDAAIRAVLSDMEQPKPMDRLVCGDVGYGKTEVALRAVLKAALGGRQIAMLAPTTVLVEQHYQTMKRRFADWPVTIGRLSRFQTKKEQVATIKGLASGAIDAVVGTHRLLSKDVRFHRLGLLVIDEEQRFGVAHKERLKQIRTQLDVLTLTATPIPRTLHTAMTGMRDLSIIATPPADRRSIRTYVSRVEDGVLREGIRNELARGGQVFFVAPRIGDSPRPGTRSLDQWASHLSELVPDARVTVAHGQMTSDTLERRMIGFVDGKADILVSTTIVESGLDIPRANTMFIADADRFGLSQLYQLRGRIGRSKERAFCYLLVPPPKELTKDAQKRLETLQRYTELGAGFSIASQDLEIRGAGELLGAKQSGAISAVGFETYTHMLDEAVAELRGESISHERDPELHVETPGFIPDEYVPDTGQRLDLYKRLASATDPDEVSSLLAEMTDRYGPLPDEVQELSELMVLKALARPLRALAIEVQKARMVLTLPEDTPLAPQRLAQLVAQHPRRYGFTPDGRLACHFTVKNDAPLSAAQGALRELVACVN